MCTNNWLGNHVLLLLLGTFTITLGIQSNGKTTEATSPKDEQPSEACGLIVNWDEINLWHYQMLWAQAEKEKTLTPEEVKTLVENIVDEHSQAGVDRLAICVLSFPWGTSTAGYKTINRAPDRGWMIGNPKIAPAMIGFDDRYDMNEVILDQSRKNGMEFIACFRMNDRHIQSNQQPFYRNHPTWRLRELPSGMDYKYEGVRNTVLSIIQEALEHHDVDGIELDWMRHCHMFNPSEAEENTAILTEFIVKTRKLLDMAAKQRGRDRLVLGVRVPQTVAECQTLGFDVEAWVQQGGVDYLCPSDFMHFDINIRVEEFVKFTEGTHCKIYPTVFGSISQANFTRGLSLDQFRAAANNFYSYGANGISAYNFYNQYRILPGNEWRQASPKFMLAEWPRALDYLTAIRDPKVIIPGNKHYGDRHYFFHPLWRSREYPTGAIKHDLIEIYRDGTVSTKTLQFRMAEDLSSADLSATLEFKVTGLVKEDMLELTLNGKTVPPKNFQREFDADGQTKQEGFVLPAFHRYRMELTSDWAKFGDNRISARLSKSGGTDSVQVRDFEVRIRDRRTKVNDK